MFFDKEITNKNIWYPEKQITYETYKTKNMPINFNIFYKELTIKLLKKSILYH